MKLKFYQQGIYDNLSPSAYYLLFSLENESNLRDALEILKKLVDGKNIILGLGEKVMARLKLDSPFYPYKPKGNQTKLAPEKSYDLALWLKSNDRGVLFYQAKQVIEAISFAFKLEDSVDATTYLAHQKNDEFINHDLSGFEDGTENPKDEAIEPTVTKQK